MMELFVTMEVILYCQSSSNLYDGGIVELYAITFSFHDKIESVEEGKDLENSSISHTGTFFYLLGARSIIRIICMKCNDVYRCPW